MKKIYKFIYNLKIKYKLPKRKKIIILDPINSNYLSKIIKNSEYLFLHTRFEEINLKILLDTFKNYNKYKSLTLYQKYLVNYIEYIKPEIIINCTSHNIFFLNLKKFFPNSKIIVIQDAFLSTRTLNEILINKLQKKITKKFNVDYLCIFGENSKNFYSKFINCKNYLTTGSIKNNYFKDKITKNNSVIFISQFKIKDGKHHNVLSSEYEKAFYKNLKIYIKKNKKKLYILSISKKFPEREKNYFDKVIGHKKYYFLQRKNLLSSYINSLNFNFFICNASTLGLELMARGKRVSFFYEFEKMEKSKNFKQAFWEKKFSCKFWSNSKNYNEFEKVLDITFNFKKKELSKAIYNNITPLVTYNKNNSIFKNLIKKVYQ